MLDKKNITEQELKNITGGMVEKDCALSTYDMNIVCPVCGEDRDSMIEHNPNPNDILTPGEYHCKRCGAYFDVKSK